MALPEWISEEKTGLVIRVFVQPRASKSEVVGPHGTPARLKIRIAAPPVDGEANEALIEFTAKALKVPKSRVSVIRGMSGRQKDIQVAEFSSRDLPPRWAG